MAFTEGGNFLNQLRNCQCVKKGTDPYGVQIVFCREQEEFFTVHRYEFCRV